MKPGPPSLRSVDRGTLPRVDLSCSAGIPGATLSPRSNRRERGPFFDDNGYTEVLIGRGGGLLFVALSMKLDSGAGLAAAAVPLRLALLVGIFLSVPSFLLHLLLLPTACDATLQVNLSVGMHGLWSEKKTVQNADLPRFPWRQRP